MQTKLFIIHVRLKVFLFFFLRWVRRKLVHKSCCHILIIDLMNVLCVIFSTRWHYRAGVNWSSTDHQTKHVWPKRRLPCCCCRSVAVLGDYVFATQTDQSSTTASGNIVKLFFIFSSRWSIVWICCRWCPWKRGWWQPAANGNGVAGGWLYFSLRYC